jgi:hypothetical protein
MQLAMTVCVLSAVLSAAAAPTPSPIRSSLDRAIPEVRAFEEPPELRLPAPDAEPAHADRLGPEELLQLESPPGHQPASVGRTVAYTLSMMAVGYGLLVVSEEVDDPDDDDFDGSFEGWPEPDDDDWHYNYVLHPLWGSETYLRAREADFGIAGSIGYSMASSLVWEYLIESWSEHPSTQDLLLTTGVGWLLGEARYTLKQRTEPKWHWLLDPIVTALSHIGIRLTKEPTGETTTTVTWRVAL